MQRKSTYRKILIFILGINMIVLLFFVYRELYNSVPNNIRIMVGKDEVFDFNLPFKANFEIEDNYKDNINVVSINNKKVPVNQINLDLNEPFIINSTQTGHITINLKLFGFLKFKKIDLGIIENKEVIPCGNPIGIYVETDGIMVLGTGVINAIDGLNYEPALNKLKSGDYITAINNVKINNKEQLIKEIQKCNGNDILVNVRRDGINIQYLISPVKTMNGEYKIGTWIRDNTQGIGTMTFITQDNRFGALGHGITDVDTSLIMQIEQGFIYPAEIVTIVKGKQGIPGELIGLINQSEKNRIGNIQKNTNQGIYGIMKNGYDVNSLKGIMPIGLKQEIVIGPATIITCVDNAVKEYEIQIDKIDINSSSPNKGMVITITDAELLDLTGGIVQGMSGSPILQNNKVIGAITHVFIQDSTKGYGTFIENMIYNLD